MDVKCRHCRKHLFNGESVKLLTAHCEVKKSPLDTGCGMKDSESCSYISPDNMPEWIAHVVHQESWTKGRLQCPHCNKRVGSFNFVNQLKCNCGEFMMPAVKIINSKVDMLLDKK